MLCHDTCGRKQMLNYSSKLFSVWASVGLGLPQITWVHESLENHSKRFPPFVERALDHGASLLGRNMDTGKSEAEQFKGHSELILWEL